jgi:hypothetical protein
MQTVLAHCRPPGTLSNTRRATTEEQEVNDLNSRQAIKPKRGRASSQVTRLVQRIRALVAEQRILETNGCTDRVEALDAEIDRLKSSLASAVRRELSETAAIASSP